MALQHGVFNVTDPTYNTEVLTSNQPGTNSTNLQAWVHLLLDPDGPTKGNGGTLQFPTLGTYHFDRAITVGRTSSGPKPYNIILMGTGQGQEAIPVLQQTGDADLFVIDTNDGTDEHDIGGTVFQDLMLSYVGPESPTENDAAIRIITKSQSVRLERVTLVDWPIGLFCEHSLRAAMVNCSVHVTNVKYAAIGLQLGSGVHSGEALEIYVAGCLFLDETSKGTGLQLYGCDQLRIADTKVDSWLQAIAITPNAATGSPKHLHFTAVSCFPKSDKTTTEGAALLIETAGTAEQPRYVAQAIFAQCEFTTPQTSTYTGGGIVINATGPEDVIDQIRFIDCHSCLWNGAGLYIFGGAPGPSARLRNVEVLGGYYSCNGRAAASNPSGIALRGAVSGVRIIGAACNNSLYQFDVAPPGFAPKTQQYGVEVQAGVSNMLIEGCDLTGNLSAGVYVAGNVAAATSNLFVKTCDFTDSPSITVFAPVTNVQVTSCPGYNDQGRILTTSAPPLNIALTVTQLGSPPYYGPAECYVDTAGAVKVNNQTVHLNSGSFYLQPLETIEIDTSVLHFTAIGK